MTDCQEQEEKLPAAITSQLWASWRNILKPIVHEHLEMR